MIALHPQFIVDESEEKKAVVIPFSEWVQILGEMEDLEEIRIYDNVKADTEDEVISFKQALNEMSKGEVN